MINWVGQPCDRWTHIRRRLHVSGASLVSLIYNGHEEGALCRCSVLFVISAMARAEVAKIEEYTQGFGHNP